MSEYWPSTITTINVQFKFSYSTSIISLWCHLAYIYLICVPLILYSFMSLPLYLYNYNVLLYLSSNGLNLWDIGFLSICSLKFKVAECKDSSFCTINREDCWCTILYYHPISISKPLPTTSIQLSSLFQFAYSSN